MVERDIHAERREALANSTLEGNRSDLIQFHLDLAKKFGSGSIPREMRDQEAASTALVQAGRLLELKKIEYARGVKNKMPDQEVNASILRLGTAMFLIDRVTEIRDAALKKNNLGIYALYSSLRDDVCRLLGPSYYSMPFKDIAGEYIIFEPSIAAASQLCGFMKTPEFALIPGLYQERLSEFVQAVLEPQESARKS
jgi:hypothetical protein